ncbi:MAG: 2Fe-2S iron-sulfur cluster-binding protein [Alphaproteobacteria bacterium]|jgi:carbon-monoxide dehydrogenase small subunit|nr:2Fe-2S iron-sulfur cluster-binding protein [Alphaproteobacteria bacterium]
MAMLELTINGKVVRAEVEPRLQLSDFLRDGQNLTATHVGCEQGVCGACTVLIDGKPARSCISYAVQNQGREITTLEGLNGDPLMQDLQQAFTGQHALQCGYCTPGMLISAHDLISRKGALDEAAIRHEMSGNLCRCTGYMGIVAAIREVGLKHSNGQQMAPNISGNTGFGLGREVPAFDLAAEAEVHTAAAVSLASGPPEPGWARLEQAFSVGQDMEAVWQYFSDPANIAGCFPGARLTAFDGQDIAGSMDVKFGPITASFSGSGRFDLDAARRRGVLQGSGADKRGGSRVKANVSFLLVPGDDGLRTDVKVTVDYLLSGPLAQFGRAGLVREFASRLSRQFADNLNRAMTGGDAGADMDGAGGISIISTTLSIIWAGIRSLFSR